MTVQVDVQHACDDDTVPEAPTIKSWIESAVAAAGIVDDSEVSVRVVSPEEIRALNSDYRGKDKATNVLSFPVGELAGLPDDMPRPLGDIVVCAGVVRDEARQQGKDLADHWAHMLVHGTLHLLGFDHELDPDAAEMEALETRILRDRGVANPYGASGEN